MNEQDEWNARLTAALEQRPSVEVPEDFAARVMARVPQQRQRRAALASLPSTSHVGKWMLIAVMFLVIVAMIVIAPRMHDSMTWGLLETLLLFQLGGAALLFGWQRAR